MRKIISNTFISLDGIMQAPGGPQEDTTGGFELGGWSVNYWDDHMMQTMSEAALVPYDLLLGRKTYEIFAAHWPFVQNDPMADKFNKATKYVATRTLISATWQNTTLLNSDFIAQIREIKAADGIEIQVHGSGDLIQTLLQHNLIDEMRIWIFPLVIGKGKRLFEEGVPAGLKLSSHTVSGSGVIITTYLPAGKIQTGSFALEEPTALEKERRHSMEKGA